MSPSLASRTVILTGASQGLGPYLARRLAAEGARLVLAARSRDKLELVAAALRADGAEVEIVVTDVTDETDRRNLVHRSRARFGQIDVLINNAGVEEILPFEEQEPEAITRMIATNVVAPLQLARLVLPEMLQAGRGHIVNIASLAGLLGMPYGSVYAGSKAALATWSLSLAAEVRHRGVHVTTICPGFVAKAGMFARKETRAPGLLGEVQPEDVAEAVLRALRTGAPQLVVTARPVRPMLVLRALAPALYMKLGEALGAVQFLRRVAAKELAKLRKRDALHRN
ncbi:MAG TPA: SDR family NAD(P)-dependent oxidoreductase [Gammaproteobacteria bacterium]|nr:SDR family NAD(P)-dependent oxidoreductase [Gammaproteobacteria bacterium]